MQGKALRLATLFSLPSRRSCIVPIDHGVTLGPVDGLVDPYKTIGDVLAAQADAVILHKGILAGVTQRPALLSGRYILHLSASTSLAPESRDKRLVATVEDAVQLGALGVSVHVNLAGPYEGAMLSDLGAVASDCARWGMPLLAMMYVAGETRPKGPSDEVAHIAHAARVAQELGADVVKVNLVEPTSSFERVTRGVSIPVLVAGGAKGDSPRTLFRRISEAMQAGAAGVAVGRNIFQSGNVTKTTRLMRQLVHGELGLDECLAQLER